MAAPTAPVDGKRSLPTLPYDTTHSTTSSEPHRARYATLFESRHLASTDNIVVVIGTGRAQLFQQASQDESHRDIQEARSEDGISMSILQVGKMRMVSPAIENTESSGLSSLFASCLGLVCVLDMEKPYTLDHARQVLKQALNGDTGVKTGLPALILVKSRKKLEEERIKEILKDIGLLTDAGERVLWHVQQVAEEEADEWFEGLRWLSDQVSEHKGLLT